jgi:O-methyltransferase
VKKTISEGFKASLKRFLYERLNLIILRGQIVLQMEKLSKLTSRDYIRVCSFELAAEEIHAQAVAGSIAELGVYKGDFAKHLSAAFPDRKLYLFDTFTGFHEQDKDVEIREGFSTASENFADTSVERWL